MIGRRQSPRHGMRRDYKRGPKRSGARPPTAPAPTLRRIAGPACCWDLDMSQKSFHFPRRNLHRYAILPLLFSSWIPFCSGIQGPSVPTSNDTPDTSSNPIAESLFSSPSDSENPRNHIWRRPPAHCLWEINFHFAAQSESTDKPVERNGAPLKITVIQHGKESVARLETEDGNHFEFWNLSYAEIDGVAGQLRVRPARVAGNSGAANKSLDAPSSETNPPPIWKVDWHSFRDFQWLRPELLRGTILVGTERMLVFAHAAPSLIGSKRLSGLFIERNPIGGLPLLDGINAAAIHEGSLLPAMLQRGPEVRTYKFSPLPQQKLEIPEHIARFLENLRASHPVKPRPTP